MSADFWLGAASGVVALAFIMGLCEALGRTARTYPAPKAPTVDRLNPPDDIDDRAWFHQSEDPGERRGGVWTW